jgi:phage baseplate assembly protein W
MGRLSDKPVLNPNVDDISILSSSKRYIDFDLSFNRNPNTGDITRLFDIDAVKQSVKNLVLTNFYERPFQPLKGADLRSVLFENDNPVLRNNVKQRIRNILNVFEPRIILKTIEVDVKENSMTITIIFSVINTKEEVESTININRVR